MVLKDGFDQKIMIGKKPQGSVPGKFMKRQGSETIRLKTHEELYVFAQDQGKALPPRNQISIEELSAFIMGLRTLPDGDEADFEEFARGFKEMLRGEDTDNVYEDAEGNIIDGGQNQPGGEEIDELDDEIARARREALQIRGLGGGLLQQQGLNNLNVDGGAGGVGGAGGAGGADGRPGNQPEALREPRPNKYQVYFDSYNRQMSPADLTLRLNVLYHSLGVPELIKAGFKDSKVLNTFDLVYLAYVTAKTDKGNMTGCYWLEPKVPTEEENNEAGFEGKTLGGYTRILFDLMDCSKSSLIETYGFDTANTDHYNDALALCKLGRSRDKFAAQRGSYHTASDEQLDCFYRKEDQILAKIKEISKRQYKIYLAKFARHQKELLDRGTGHRVQKPMQREDFEREFGKRLRICYDLTPTSLPMCVPLKNIVDDTYNWVRQRAIPGYKPFDDHYRENLVYHLYHKVLKPDVIDFQGALDADVKELTDLALEKETREGPACYWKVRPPRTEYADEQNQLTQTMILQGQEATNVLGRRDANRLTDMSELGRGERVLVTAATDARPIAHAIRPMGAGQGQN